MVGSLTDLGRVAYEASPMRDVVKWEELGPIHQSTYTDIAVAIVEKIKSQCKTVSIAELTDVYWENVCMKQMYSSNISDVKTAISHSIKSVVLKLFATMSGTDGKDYYKQFIVEGRKPKVIIIDQINMGGYRKLDSQILAYAKMLTEGAVCQPILVSNMGDGYEIIDGVRRVQAYELAGLVFIPAYVVEHS